MGTIAVVDDNESGAETVVCMLKVSGIKDVKSYNSGKELLVDMHSGYHPDLVISDFFMPEMNGVELLDTIDELYGTVPGVIITGYPEGIQSVSRRNNNYPIVCKGRPDFFHELIKEIEKNLRDTGDAVLPSLFRRRAE